MSASKALLDELTALGAIGPLQGRMSTTPLAREPEPGTKVPKGPLDEAKIRSLCSEAIGRLDQIDAVVQDLRTVFTGINESLDASDDERDDDDGEA